jgi:hypothetical protein
VITFIEYLQLVPTSRNTVHGSTQPAIHYGTTKPSQSAVASPVVANTLLSFRTHVLLS